MSLVEQQNFLARLYTEENLRRSFLAEPAKIGAENDLSETEIAELAAIIPAELNFFADSLVWKRLREAEKLLPLVKKALGADFEKYFRRFANQFLPKTIKKHLEDATEFCSFLRSSEIEPGWKKDLAKFEQARLHFNAGGERFVLRTFDYDIRQIAREIAGGNAPADFPKRRTRAVWLRAGSRTKFFAF
jgi:hypothetical protein